MKTLELFADHKACYTAMKTHDARFDGRFFCGVASTGIYCRPVCRVKLPREENCTFFAGAAAAEKAGYRPCLKCRPELAPGLAWVDSFSRLARSAALIIEEDCMTGRKILDLSAVLGITDRHLRRVFYAEYRVSPVQYLQTRRLLLAKSLLADTRLTVTDVAMAAGFGSIRRFNDLFKKNYGLTPSRLRENGKSSAEDSGEITLSLGYRPPYAWGEMLSFLALRAIPGVESVTEGVYRRTVSIMRDRTVYSGWISVSNLSKQNALSITLAPALFPVLPQVLARIRHLFDINCSPEEVYDKLCAMNRFVPGVTVPGMRLPGCFDSFEMSARAVLGQHVTVKAANTLAMRLAAAFGEKTAAPFVGLDLAFPRPEKICALDSPIESHLGPLGITGAKSRSILALAKALMAGIITLSYRADPGREMEELGRLPGVGPWTVQYLAMRALGWPDAFPHTDYGVKKALSGRTAGEILELSKAWRPWRSYATVTLWNSLNKSKSNQGKDS